MNIAFGLMMLLSIVPFGLLGADSEGVEGVAAPEYYATGTLGAQKCTEVLKLMSKLRTLDMDQEGNQKEYVSIRQKLKKHGIDVDAVEAMFRIDALVIKTKDNGIFLVEKKYDAILQDYCIKGNKVLVLGVESGEIRDIFVDLKYCYEQELARDAAVNQLKIEQDKLEKLRKERKELERIIKLIQLDIQAE